MIVLDASAAIEIAQQTEHGMRYENLMYSGEKIISVDLMNAEVAYVFSKYARLEACSDAQATALTRKAISLVDEYYDMSGLLVEAMNEGLRLHHSAYDMFYFVLARRTGATLFTHDNKLAKLCVQNGVNCVREFVADNEDYTTRIEVQTLD